MLWIGKSKYEKQNVKYLNHFLHRLHTALHCMLIILQMHNRLYKYIIEITFTFPFAFN